MKTRKNKTAVFVKNTVSNIIDPFVYLGSSIGGSSLFWRWGHDNMYPVALSIMYRNATAHRRVINDKADYISGRGIAFDDKNTALGDLVAHINNCESLREMLNKVSKDKVLFGNAFVEVVTNRKRSFLSLYHQDATRCRLSKDKANIILHHDWSEYAPAKAKEVALWPNFSEHEDGTIRSIIHYKDYEPMFENYGVPSYVAGMGVSAIAYKTDRWNISRLDNSFQMSGVMTLDAAVQSEEEAEEIVSMAEKKFAGKPGQVLFLVGNNGDSKAGYTPIASSNEGDWKSLHEQSTSDIVVAHSWFRSLSGLDYSTGFNSERVLNEYQIAINTVIQPEQAELLEPLKNAIEMIAHVDASSLEIINRPPIVTKPEYMMIWEARRLDGLDYDENDPRQQAYLSQIKTGNNGNTNIG